MIGYHRSALAAGSVNKLFPIPGVAGNAHGFRGIPEALHLRDHVVRQIEMADAAEDLSRASGPAHVRGGRGGLHRYGGCRPDPIADP